MNITQTFYNNLASQYDKLFYDWKSETHEQALILDKIFGDNGYDNTAQILDCACGIGTQSVGLASMGYNVTASDISEAEIEEAKKRSEDSNVKIRFEYADFCALSKTFSNKFDIVIAMDNALPHMMTKSDLEIAIKSIINQVKKGGMFVASIRDYDTLLKDKPPYSPPYIHKTDKGQRISFQTWNWEGDCYNLTQYIIDDENSLGINKFECQYRAVCREELTNLLNFNSCISVEWIFPEQSGFYQPIVVAKK